MKTQLERRSLLVRANVLYRQGNPIMPDSSWDQLLSQYKSDFPGDNIEESLRASERTQKDREEKLPIPMYSLDKLKDLDEITTWMIRVARESKVRLQDLEFIITPKFDGVSMCRDERTGASWLRGDGRIGQRIDGFSSFFEEGALEIPFISIGELIIPKNVFMDKYSEEYANARNMVAGILNRKEPVGMLKSIEYIKYGLDSSNMCKSTELEFLSSFSSSVSPYVKLPFSHICKARLSKIFNEWKQEFDIDGLVIEIDSKRIRGILGRETNSNPAYSKAIKFPEWGSTAECTVKSVEIEISKQGLLKPVITIEPVMISGVTVERVTGFNMRYVFNHHIHPGCRILITRSGEVIPKHLETLEFDQNKMVDMNIYRCPSCGKDVFWNDSGAELQCLNPDCPEMRKKKIEHFFKVMGADGIGIERIGDVYDAGKTSLVDFYSLRLEFLKSLSGWGEVSAQNFLNEVSRVFSKEIPIPKLLHALDIFKGKLGEKIIQKILDSGIIEYGVRNGVNFIALSTNISNYYNHLLKIEGISDTTAQVFLNNFGAVNLFQNVAIVRAVKFAEKSNLPASKGVTVCFTGVRPKGEIRAMMSQFGYYEVDGVSKNTEILVVKDIDTTSSKAEKARKLGVKIMSMEQFVTLLREFL